MAEMAEIFFMVALLLCYPNCVRFRCCSHPEFIVSMLP